MHLALCLVLATLVATVVLRVLYPPPFATISGGLELFLIVLAVDVVVGPLLTLAVFDIRKPRREIAFDLAAIGLIQLAALGYGIFTVTQARPVALALETDRLRVVRAIDVPSEELAKGPEEYRRLPRTGIVNVAARQARPEERFEAVQLALAGLDIGARPEFWLPPAHTGAAWAEGGQPISKLRAKHPSRAAEIDASITATGRPESALKYLPIIARRTDYVALIESTSGALVAYAPFDGF